MADIPVTGDAPERQAQRAAEAADRASAERAMRQRKDLPGATDAPASRPAEAKAQGPSPEQRFQGDAPAPTEAARPADSFRGQPVVERHTDRKGREMLVTQTADLQAGSSMSDGSRLYQLYEAGHEVGASPAGMVDVAFERSHEQMLQGGNPAKFEKVRINFIEVFPSHQGAGNSGPLLDQVEKDALSVGASEIHGAVTDEGARSFWKHMQRRGYELDEKGTHVSKKVGP